MPSNHAVLTIEHSVLVHVLYKLTNAVTVLVHTLLVSLHK